MQSGRDVLTRSMTEAEILSAFFDLEDRAHLGFTFHLRDGRGQRVEGLPDLITILPDFVGGCGVVGLFEVKTQRDRVSARQAAILAALDACNSVVSGIIRPIPKEGELSIDDALRDLGIAT